MRLTVSRLQWFPLLLISWLMLAAVLPVQAQETTENDGWQCDFTVYGYLPQIYGHLNYDIPDSGDTITVDPSTLLDNLDMTFMTSFELRKNRWSVIADLMYVKEKAEQDNSVTVPWDDGEFVDVGTELQLDMWITSLYGAYEVSKTDRATFGVLAGARRISMDADLALDIDGPLPTTLPTDRFSRSAVMFDGVVGIRGRLGTKDKWYIPYHIDIGTGSSTFTWQGMTGIGYNWHWGGVIAAYRYLYFDEGDQYLIEDMALGGGAVGVHFNW